jgi:serine/threonine-protein kinase
MYSLCVKAGICNPPIKYSSRTRSSYFGNPEYADFPVIYVDWYAADTYCRWVDGRLPTEAEWEKAARGIDERLFPWGDELPDANLANVGQMVGDTTGVGSYQNGASPYGLMDMAGNVYEWVADWFSPNYYAQSDYRNPLGPPNAVGEKPRRVVRGGNLYWEPVYATSGFHDYWEPYQTSNDVGFRCVWIPP